MPTARISAKTGPCIAQSAARFHWFQLPMSLNEIAHVSLVRVGHPTKRARKREKEKKSLVDAGRTSKVFGVVHWLS